MGQHCSPSIWTMSSDYCSSPRLLNVYLSSKLASPPHLCLSPSRARMLTPHFCPTRSASERHSRVAESLRYNPSMSTFRPLDTLADIASSQAMRYATPTSPQESESEKLTPEREEALQRALRAAPKLVYQLPGCHSFDPDPYTRSSLRSENRSSPLMSLSHILHGSPDSRLAYLYHLLVFTNTVHYP